MMLKLLMRYYFGYKEEIVVHLTPQPKPGSLFVVLPPQHLWVKDSLTKRMSSLLTFRYKPTPDLLQQVAKASLLSDIFGGEEDNADAMLKMAVWHHSRSWQYEYLTTEDAEKANAVSVLTLGTRTRFANLHFNVMPLRLEERAAEMVGLLAPIALRIPVIAIRYFVDIHYEYAFNSIRKAEHPKASALIGYLYEVCLLQQKIFTALNEFVRLIVSNSNKKEDTLLTQAEVDSVQHAESAITNLKASIEKMINLVALIFGIEKLDEKKSHKQKIEALKNGIPGAVQELFYWQTIFHFVSSDNVEELNKYRTGLVHKMGVGKLQPHRFVGKKSEDAPFMEVFNFLHEQYTRNTIVFIGILALLVDDLVKRDPPKLEEVEEFGRLMDKLGLDIK